ncbi:MAG TPA: response regulator [bacterium]|nr:response regulator [bacterium]
MGKTILVADDEKIVRDSVRLCLESEGYEIHEAEDSAQALARARELRPDLVILDLMMPDKWGYAVCEELKKDPATKNIPVMFLTARKGAPSRKIGEIKGGDAYLAKPFAPEELREKVRKLLKQE